MRSVSGFFVSLSLLIATPLAPSWAFASEGRQEAPSGQEGTPRPTLEDVRGWAGLFGGISTAGAGDLESGALFGGGGAFYFSRRLGIEVGVERRSHPQGIEAGVVHGTACAEVVHDMAPDAELYLANFDSISGHGEAVDWLVSQQVDVISYSIGWLNQGPGDGRGVINDHVRRALGAGVEWVVAAGNEAQTHWEGAFSDPNGNGWHNYASLDETNTVSLRAGDLMIVFLNWDDWFQSNQDYDLYIFDQSLRLMTWSTNFQTGTQPPTEVAGLIAPFSGNYHVAVYQYSASRNARLEAFFIVISPEGQLQYVVPAGSITIPADTDGAIAVGATYWANDQGEPFSSRGPTSDGRTKPDLSAPDGVDTASYLAEGQPFYGTSAAAPHVAGAIALLKDRFGIFSLDQVVEILYGRAIDRGPTGKDNQYGEGRLDLIGR